MNKKISPKVISLVFGVLVICFAIGFYALAVWTEPGVAPPGGNVDAPINVGGVSQIKSGALGIGGVLRGFSNLVITGNSTNPVGGVCPSGYNWYDDGDGIYEAGECKRTSLYTTLGGNVGIGTTGPIAKLDILSATRTGTHPSVIKGLYVTGGFGAASDGVEFRHSNATQGIGFGYNTIYAAGTNANQDLNLMPKGTGNVGIGTTSPSTNLHVVGGIRVTGLANCNTSNTIDTDANGNFICGTDETGAGGVTGSGTLNYLAKWSAPTNLTNSLIYDNGTNVGIGTGTPQARLDVDDAANTNSGIRLGNDSAACSAAKAGTMRYNTGVMQYCNGTIWLSTGLNCTTRTVDGSGTNLTPVIASCNADEIITGGGCEHTTEIGLAWKHLYISGNTFMCYVTNTTPTPARAYARCCK